MWMIALTRIVRTGLYKNCLLEGYVVINIPEDTLASKY